MIKINKLGAEFSILRVSILVFNTGYCAGLDISRAALELDAGNILQIFRLHDELPRLLTADN